MAFALADLVEVSNSPRTESPGGGSDRGHEGQEGQEGKYHGRTRARAWPRATSEGASGALTSDHGLVYHLKQGLSKHVLSSGGFLARPHSGPLRVCGFPLASSMHRTSLFFTPRPHVVLH